MCGPRSCMVQKPEQCLTSWLKDMESKEDKQRSFGKDQNESKLFLKIIQVKKLKYFGHTICHNPLQRTVMEGSINAKRGRGRPRITWTEAAHAAEDGNKWRTTASNPHQEDVNEFPYRVTLWQCLIQEHFYNLHLKNV